MLKNLSTWGLRWSRGMPCDELAVLPGDPSLGETLPAAEVRSVEDPFGIVLQIDDDLNGSIGEQFLFGVLGGVAAVIPESLHELVQGEGRRPSPENHSGSILGHRAFPSKSGETLPACEC